MKWEYKTIKLNTSKYILASVFEEGKLDQIMNQMGAEGWELVTAFDTNVGSGQTKDIVAIFKRQQQ
jgi:hypothetical protein